MDKIYLLSGGVERRKKVAFLLSSQGIHCCTHPGLLRSECSEKKWFWFLIRRVLLVCALCRCSKDISKGEWNYSGLVRCFETPLKSCKLVLCYRFLKPTILKIDTWLFNNALFLSNKKLGICFWGKKYKNSKLDNLTRIPVIEIFAHWW